MSRSGQPSPSTMPKLWIILLLTLTRLTPALAHGGGDKSFRRLFTPPPTDPPGGFLTLDPDKKGLFPIREMEQKANSLVELTCIKAYKENMEGTPEAMIESIKPGGFNWCEALDETPTAARNTTYIVLVRMKLKYTGPLSPDNNNRDLYFYIVASRDTKAGKTYAGMEVLAIIPRIPCIALHSESVSNIQVYSPGEYFTVPGGEDGTRLPGCHDTYRSEKDKHIYVTRMVFTGGHSNHLFLYGSRLVQSTDGGRSFVALRDHFPYKLDEDKPSKTRTSTYPEIEVMSFDRQGHYAFLTNEKELWIGSTGDVRQIRIRPSDGYSVMQAMPTTDEEIELYGDGEDVDPFSVIYNEDDVLHEVVVVSGPNKTNQKIRTRRIPIDFILRYQKLHDKLKRVSTTGQTDDDEDDDHRNHEEDVDFVYDDPAKWSLYCPSSTVKYYEDYVEGMPGLDAESIKEVKKPPTPVLTPKGTIANKTQRKKLRSDNNHPARWANKIAIENVDWKIVRQLASVVHDTTVFNPDQFDRWVLNKEESAKIAHLQFVSGEKLATKSMGNRLLDHYYLDYGSTLRLELSYSIKTDAVVGERDFQTQRADKVQLNVDNPNGTLLQVDTEKIALTAEASVKFIIHISISRSDSLTQNFPGQNMLSFHLIFHLIGGFGNCAKRLSDPFSTESQSTVIYVGCRPTTDIMFNWNRTLYSIKFKDRNAHYGRGDDCYNDEFVCFFARSPLVFFFDIYDIVKQTYVAYTGNYLLRVVAGGYTRDTMEDYTDEQQQGYNIPGVSDVSLVWNEWDLTTNKKIDRGEPEYDVAAFGDITRSSKERVLKSGVSAIQWACHTLSPCARIVPNSKFQSIFWFRILISNRGVDNNTLCLYEREFDIMMYGFPPSPETQLFTTIIFCLCMLGILYILFICLRAHKKVWRAARLRMAGWYLIVRDTFPKGLKTHEEQGPDELLTQQQKDNIILSLQGHLKIPPLVPRESAPGLARSEARGRDSRASVQTRDSQISLISGSSVLAETDKDEEQSTWTDMVYEQIISKRLAAIVDKNKKMRANILRRTSLHDTSIEQEKRYEHEHKKTIAEESLFTGKPEPKS